MLATLRFAFLVKEPGGTMKRFIKFGAMAALSLGVAMPAMGSFLYTVESGPGIITTFIEPTIVTSNFTVTSFLINTPVSGGSVITSLNLAPNFGQTCSYAFGSNFGPCFAANLTGGSLIGFATPTFTAAFTSVGTFGPAVGGTSVTITEIAAVTEPATLALIGLGLVGFMLTRRHKSN